jgi:hypothetical protein
MSKPTLNINNLDLSSSLFTSLNETTYLISQSETWGISQDASLSIALIHYQSPGSVDFISRPPPWVKSSSFLMK